jgi:hypothetical protein
MFDKSKKKRLNKKIKTKKRRQNRSNKYRGGDAPLKTPDEIMQEVKDERTMKTAPQATTPSDPAEEGDGVVYRSADLVENVGERIVSDSTNLAAGVTLNAIERTTALVGVDLTDADATNKKLDEIKANFNDPKTQEKVQEVVGEAAKVGVVAVDASKPFVNKFMATVADEGGEVLTKFGETGIKVLLNTATEIPGVGVVIGTVRSVSNIGEAVAATANATSEVVTASADTVNAATKNFDQLIDEKQDIEKRTQSSVSKYEDPLKHVVPEKSAVPPHIGGTRKYNHKKKRGGKSKRVRFELN